MRHLLKTCLLATLLAATAAQAQELEVISFSETSDIISVADRRQDRNRQYCALVKVQVTDDIDRVEGPVMGDIGNHGVEKWVYMSKNARQMTIHTANHLPLRVNFRDYHINGLKSNTIYVLRLRSNAPQQAQAPVAQGLLRLEGIPEGAVISISSDLQETRNFSPQADGRLEVPLPYGRYNYSILAEGYLEFGGDIFVSDNENWQPVNMQRIMGLLTVNCMVRGVEYYINGELKGTEPLSLQLEPGTYFVEVRKRRQTKGKQVNVMPGKTSIVTISGIEAASEVYVRFNDGMAAASQPSTPAAPVATPAQSPDNSASATTYNVRFMVRPKTATITLNGRTYTPDSKGNIKVTLPGGRHTFTAQASGYQTKSDHINLNLGNSIWNRGLLGTALSWDYRVPVRLKKQR